MERDVREIVRQDMVHCFQMALKRLRNLFELVDSRPGADGEGEGGGGGSSSSNDGAGSSDD